MYSADDTVAKIEQHPQVLLTVHEVYESCSGLRFCKQTPSNASRTLVHAAAMFPDSLPSWRVDFFTECRFSLTDAASQPKKQDKRFEHTIWVQRGRKSHTTVAHEIQSSNVLASRRQVSKKANERKRRGS